MAQSPEEKSNEIIAKGKKDTAILKDLLNEMDDTAVPQLKTQVESQDTTEIIPSDIPEIKTTTQIPSTEHLTPLPPIAPAGNVVQEGKLTPLPQISVPPTPPNYLETEIATGHIFKDFQIFFKQYGGANRKRYELWETTMSTILKILRKMQQNQQENTELMLLAIEKLLDKIQKGIKEFILKRDEIERFADTDYKQVQKNLKKTLDLLSFQILEIKLEHMTSSLFDIWGK